MKQIALSLTCLIVSPIFGAETGDKTLVDDLVKHWQTSKSLSLAVADAMPGQAYRPFKPSDSEWNFADEMGSLALVNVLSCTMAFHTEAPKRFQSAFDQLMDQAAIDQRDSTFSGTPSRMLLTYLGRPKCTCVRRESTHLTQDRSMSSRSESLL
jgi:hypothetical protein